MIWGLNVPGVVGGSALGGNVPWVGEEVIRGGGGENSRGDVTRGEIVGGTHPGEMDGGK